MNLSPREMLNRLVAFPTVSDRSNLDLVDFVENYLLSHGITSVRVPSPDGTKAAHYASVGPDHQGGVVLSGHTDVVPIAGQDWDSDPYTVHEADARLYGRGTCDMKGFDALALTALVAASKRDLKRPLQIALSYDEENGMTGAPPMIDHMQGHGMIPASMVIVGEPSMIKTVTGHKGGFGYQVCARYVRCRDFWHVLVHRPKGIRKWPVSRDRQRPQSRTVIGRKPKAAAVRRTHRGLSPYRHRTPPFERCAGHLYLLARQMGQL